MSNDDLMLDVGTANEIKLALRRAGYTNAEVREIIRGGFLAEVLKVIKGKSIITEKEENVLRLLLDGIPMPFVSREPILVLKIINSCNHLWRSEDENFLYWFSSSKTEAMKETERRYLSCYEVLKPHTKTKPATNFNIFSEVSKNSFSFSDKGIFGIGIVLFLMGQSIATHKKTILNKDAGNIFFVKDTREIIRLVCVSYKNNYWYLRAMDAYDNGTAWDGGQRVFCPTFPVHDISLE